MGKSGNPAKRAEQETPTEWDPSPVDEHGAEDFDAFWSEQTETGPTVKIKGETYQLPASLPLAFEMEAKRLQRSEKLGDVRKVLGHLGFSKADLDSWVRKGMTSDEFQLLLAYLPAKIGGSDVTMAEVWAAMQGTGEGDTPKA